MSSTLVLMSTAAQLSFSVTRFLLSAAKAEFLLGLTKNSALRGSCDLLTDPSNDSCKQSKLDRAPPNTRSEFQAAALMAADHGPGAGLPGRRRCLFGFRSFYHIILVVNGQDLPSIHSNLHRSFIPLWQPEFADLLVLPHKVSSINPEREFSGRMAFDSDDGVIFDINPQFSFKQVLVLSPGGSLHGETTVRSYLLFAEQRKSVVVRGDGAIMMLLAGGGFDFAGNQRVQGQVTDDSRPSFGCHDKSLLVRRVKLHSPNLLRAHLPRQIDHLIGS